MTIIFNNATNLTPEFDNMSAELADEIVKTFERFGETHNLGTLDMTGLKHVTADLKALGSEALMFGFNTWPDDLPGGSVCFADA